jgi:LmbE family N-acetylglucosaminyl deacetylase
LSNPNYIEALYLVSKALGHPFAGDHTKTIMDYGSEVTRQLAAANAHAERLQAKVNEAWGVEGE